MYYIVLNPFCYLLCLLCLPDNLGFRSKWEVLEFATCDTWNTVTVAWGRNTEWSRTHHRRSSFILKIYCHTGAYSHCEMCAAGKRAYVLYVMPFWCNMKGRW